MSKRDLINRARSGERVTLRSEYYRELAIEYYGLPTPCYFCQQPVEQITGGNGAVHHIDHDALNNVRENVAVCHVSCHARYHGAQPRAYPTQLTPEHRAAIACGVRGTVHSETSRANMSAAAKRRFRDAEQRKLVGRSKIGVPKTAAHRAALSAAASQKVECPACNKFVGKSWLSRHKCEGGE